MSSLSLLDLPAEIRLHIYSFIPELQRGTHTMLGSTWRFRSGGWKTSGSRQHHLIPPICQVSQRLRRETLPLHTKDRHFILWQNSTIVPLVRTLGTAGLSTLRSLSLHCYWNIARSRDGSRVHHSRIMFSICLARSLDDGTWTCTARANTRSCHRLHLWSIKRMIMQEESVELLRRVILGALPSASAGREHVKPSITVGTVRLVAAAMEIVAAHPIEELFDLDQQPKAVQKQQRRQTRQTWLQMQGQLCSLNILGDHSLVMPAGLAS